MDRQSLGNRRDERGRISGRLGEKPFPRGIGN